MRVGLLRAGLAGALALTIIAPAWAGVNKLTLEWTSNYALTHQTRIERAAGSCSAGNVFLELATVGPVTIPAPSQETYVDAPLAGGETWCYRVRVEDVATGLFSDYSNMADATVSGLPTPGGAPTGLRVTSAPGEPTQAEQLRDATVAVLTSPVCLGRNVTPYIEGKWTSITHAYACVQALRDTLAALTW